MQGVGAPAPGSPCSLPWEMTASCYVRPAPAPTCARSAPRVPPRHRELGAPGENPCLCKPPALKDSLLEKPSSCSRGTHWEPLGKGPWTTGLPQPLCPGSAQSDLGFTSCGPEIQPNKGSHADREQAPSLTPTEAWGSKNLRKGLHPQPGSHGEKEPGSESGREGPRASQAPTSPQWGWSTREELLLVVETILTA